jgi:hypothetical protein
MSAFDGVWTIHQWNSGLSTFTRVTLFTPVYLYQSRNASPKLPSIAATLQSEKTKFRKQCSIILPTTELGKSDGSAAPGILSTRTERSRSVSAHVKYCPDTVQSRISDRRR